MEIILADKAGFCYGVKRAVEMTEKELSNTKEKVYSLGPLIHNPQAVKEFEEKGLMVIDEISEIRDSKVIIRSHGVSKEIVDKMKEQNIDIVDSTCPYVKSVHNKVEEYHKQGYNIVIVGD